MVAIADIESDAIKLLSMSMDIDLHEYDIIIINSSGGKDSIAAMYEICRMAKEQHYPKSSIVVSHQDLGKMEWKGTKDLAQKQADFFGLKCYFSSRRTAEGKAQSLLDYAIYRGKWPSNKQRWCTSEFKRGPGSRVVTQLTIEMGKCKVLYVFGFRADESPARSKRKVMDANTLLTTKKRTVMNYLPVRDKKPVKKI